MYVASPPLLFVATNDLVELAGTSEDLAIGISILFAITGSREVVGELVGDGADTADELCDVAGEATGIGFPESHIKIVLPLFFPLMQV